MKKISTSLIQKSTVRSTNEAEDRAQLLEELRTLEAKVQAMHAKKLKLESEQLPQPVTIDKENLQDDAEHEIDDSLKLRTLKLNLKFHELSGMVVTKYDENEMIIEYKTHMEHYREHYAIKIGTENDKLEILQAFTPHSVRIGKLSEQYPLSESMELTRVIGMTCQTYHDIKHQVESLRVYFKGKSVEVFNSKDYTYVELAFKVSYSRTSGLYNVTVSAHFPTTIPRPERISVDCEEMNESLLRILKNQFQILKKFPLEIGFEIATTRNKDTMFYFYDEPDDNSYFFDTSKQHIIAYERSSSDDHSISENKTPNRTQTSKSVKRRTSMKTERDVSNKSATNILNRPQLKSVENTSMVKRSQTRTTKSSAIQTKINFPGNDLSSISFNATRQKLRNNTPTKGGKNKLTTSTPTAVKQKQKTSPVPVNNVVKNIDQLLEEPYVALTRLDKSEAGFVVPKTGNISPHVSFMTNVNSAQPVRDRSGQLVEGKKTGQTSKFVANEKPAVNIKRQKKVTDLMVVKPDDKPQAPQNAKAPQKKKRRYVKAPSAKPKKEKPISKIATNKKRAVPLVKSSPAKILRSNSAKKVV